MPSQKVQGRYSSKQTAQRAPNVGQPHEKSKNLNHHHKNGTLLTGNTNKNFLCCVNNTCLGCWGLSGLLSGLLSERLEVSRGVSPYQAPERGAWTVQRHTPDTLAGRVRMELGSIFYVCDRDWRGRIQRCSDITVVWYRGKHLHGWMKYNLHFYVILTKKSLSRIK